MRRFQAEFCVVLDLSLEELLAVIFIFTEFFFNFNTINVIILMEKLTKGSYFIDDPPNIMVRYAGFYGRYLPVGVIG